MEVPGIPRSHWWLDVSHDTRRTGHANLARAVVQDRIVASGGPKGSLQAVPYGEHDAVRDKGEFQRYESQGEIFSRSKTHYGEGNPGLVQIHSL